MKISNKKLAEAKVQKARGDLLKARKELKEALICGPTGSFTKSTTHSTKIMGYTGLHEDVLKESVSEKSFDEVNIGDIGHDYAGNKVRIIAKGKLEDLIQYDTTGACDDWLEEDPEYATTADCVAVEDVDSPGSAGTFVYPYGGDGVLVSSEDLRVRQISFDFIDDGVDEEDLISRIKDAMEVAGIEIVGGPAFGDTSWSKEEYGLNEEIIDKGKYGIEVKDPRGLWVPASANYPKNGEPVEFKKEDEAKKSDVYKRLVDRYGEDKVRTYKQDE